MLSSQAFAGKEFWPEYFVKRSDSQHVGYGIKDQVKACSNSLGYCETLSASKFVSYGAWYGLKRQAKCSGHIVSF